MPGLYKDEGVVLRSIPLGEADRIVTMFTRRSGKVRAVAKGVRKTKSRFGGRLEPFTRVSLVIYRGRNLDTITSADILTSFREIREDYERLSAAGALVELVDKISPEHDRMPSTYVLLLSALAAIAGGAPATIVPAFTVKLLSLSGYHPQLKRCAGCGTASGLCGFSAEFGGAVCDPCRRTDRNALRLASDRLAVLSRLLAGDFGEPADRAAVLDVTNVLRHYAEYHIERPLRALGLLRVP